MSHNMFKRCLEYKWKCAGCKTCLKCKQKRDNRMLFCDQCDRGYHIYCLGLRNIPEGKQTLNLDEFFIHILLKPFHIPQIQNYVGHKIIEFEMKITRMYFKNSCASPSTNDLWENYSLRNKFS